MIECPRCGALNHTHTEHDVCVGCGVVFGGMELKAVRKQTDDAGASYASLLVKSILVTLFCCQPFGIVAIVYSALTMGHNDAGRYQQAHKTAKTAMMWNYIGLGVGLAVGLGWMLFVLVLGGLGSAGTTP